MIRTALAEKQRLVADILHVPHAELDSSSLSLPEIQHEPDGEKEARLLVMTAIAQGRQHNTQIYFHEFHSKFRVFHFVILYFLLCFSIPATQLTVVLNESLRITEEEAIAAVSDPSPAAAAGSSSAASPRTSRRINRMPGAPTSKLLAITSALNRDLTQLLVIFNPY